jgi:hypothetical protein
MAVGKNPPLTYEEFFQDYWKYTITILRNNWRIPNHEVEDMASRIMTRFVERDFLPKYDPEKAEGAGFKTFWIGFIRAYVMGWRKDLLKRQATERHYDSAETADIVDIYIGPDLTDQYDVSEREMDAKAEFQALREHLSGFRIQGQDVTYADVLDDMLEAVKTSSPTRTLVLSGEDMSRIMGLTRQGAKNRALKVIEHARAWKK